MAEEVTIYLAQTLLFGSSELPNLLLHRKGFTASPRRRGTKDVAKWHHLTFHVSSRRTSIVSVALSLGFDLTLKSTIPALEFRSYAWLPLATFLVDVSCDTKGVRTFLMVLADHVVTR